MTSPRVPAAPLQLHRGPAAGFDEPFEMLAACHERVARMLALLERLAGHLREHGADAPAAQAAADVLRYFDQAGPAHHQDEERHVLPWLRANGRVALAERIAAEHAAMNAAWAALRPGLQAVAAGRMPDTPGPHADAAAGSDARDAAWAAFAAAYRAHIALEDAEAFAPCAAGTDADARAAMGAEMAARRGVPAGLAVRRTSRTPHSSP